MIWEQIDVVVAVACFAGLALFMIRNDTPSNWWGPMSHSPNRAHDTPSAKAMSRRNPFSSRNRTRHRDYRVAKPGLGALPDEWSRSTPSSRNE
jgi:hypothetical protein